MALNQDRLARTTTERAALVRWFEYQKQRFGGKESNIHKRGRQVDWFRIGFATEADALVFISDLARQARESNAFARWAIRRKPADRQNEVTAAAADQLAEQDVDAGGADDAGPAPDHPGNLTNKEYALACIPVLVEHVLRQTDGVMQTMTYGELARRLGRVDKHGRPAPKGLGSVLGMAMEHIDRVSGPGQAPYLTVIVVEKSGKDKGLPGFGVRGRWKGYDELTHTEKLDRLEAEYQRILKMGSWWNEVLAKLGLPHAADGASAESDEGGAAAGWAGGESPQHKALKTFVCASPHLFGVDDEESWDCRASEEYALRSGDEIDVFFKMPNRWIGVEVKSSVSDGNPKDYERGIYQAVKYRAVLEAQARVDHPHMPPSITVFLALENELPEQLCAIAAALGVRLVEHLGYAMAKDPALASDGAAVSASSST